MKNKRPVMASIVHLELSTELPTGGQWRCIKVDIEGQYITLTDQQGLIFLVRVDCECNHSPSQ
jgi:hypothetical protein